MPKATSKAAIPLPEVAAHMSLFNQHGLVFQYPDDWKPSVDIVREKGYRRMAMFMRSEEQDWSGVEVWQYDSDDLQAVANGCIHWFETKEFRVTNPRLSRIGFGNYAISGKRAFDSGQNNGKLLPSLLALTVILLFVIAVRLFQNGPPAQHISSVINPKPPSASGPVVDSSKPLASERKTDNEKPAPKVEEDAPPAPNSNAGSTTAVTSKREPNTTPPHHLVAGSNRASAHATATKKPTIPSSQVWSELDKLRVYK